MKPSPDIDQRIETRLQAAETIFIEVVSTSAGGHDPSNIIICNSMDLSANGLQVVVDDEIPINSILRLCIDIHDRDPIYLIGEVMWTKCDTESDGFRVGFSLIPSDGTDIQSWKEVIAELLR